MPEEKRHRIRPLILAKARELRRPMTSTERKLWPHLRGSRLGGYKFRRQYPTDRFIPDFYCAACKLIVEIDGETHTGQVERDAERTACMNAQGFYVLRFTNQDVHTNLEGVLTAILTECQRLSAAETSPDTL